MNEMMNKASVPVLLLLFLACFSCKETPKETDEVDS